MRCDCIILILFQYFLGTCCIHHQEYNTAVGSHWYNMYALDHEMYGSTHFKGCLEWLVVTSQWLSWNAIYNLDASF
jgi:hypothetical protein